DSTLKRRVLILMTDGLDNASSKEVKVDVVATIKSALIPVFTLIAYDPTVRNMNLAELPPPRIASVSDESGGRYFGALSETQARNAMMFVATIVDNQYHLRFEPEQATGPHKTRSLEIKLQIDKSDWKKFESPQPFYPRKYLPAQ